MLSISDGFGRSPDEGPDAQVPGWALPAYIRGEISELIKFAPLK